MKPTPLSLSGAEFADLLGIKHATLNARLKKHGDVEGVVPFKLPNGRYRFPRIEALTAAGIADIDTKPLDLADTLGFFADRGLPVDDPMIVAASKCLVGTFSAPGYAHTAADDTQRLSRWVNALRQRTQAVHLSDCERRTALLYLDKVESELVALRATLTVGGVA